MRHRRSQREPCRWNRWRSSSWNRVPSGQDFQRTSACSLDPAPRSRNRTSPRRKAGWPEEAASLRLLSAPKSPDQTVWKEHRGVIQHNCLRINDSRKKGLRLLCRAAQASLALTKKRTTYRLNLLCVLFTTKASQQAPDGRAFTSPKHFWVVGRVETGLAGRSSSSSGERRRRVVLRSNYAAAVRSWRFCFQWHWSADSSRDRST